jgi:tetratricopeptide (TPR) repeat protein
VENSPFKPGRDFFAHLLLELESLGRMLLAPPERRAQIRQMRGMLRLNRQANLYALARYREQAAFRDVLRRRPLSVFPRVNKAIWRDFTLFAPDLTPRRLPANQEQAGKAYDLAARRKPDAALRVIDALIARLKDRPTEELDPHFMVNVHLFAGAVGYMICDETAGVYYAAAVELASYKTNALLVLGAIFVRLGRTGEARAAWERALLIERERFENAVPAPNALKHWEDQQDALVQLEALEKMVSSLDSEAPGDV